MLGEEKIRSVYIPPLAPHELDPDQVEKRLKKF